MVYAGREPLFITACSGLVKLQFMIIALFAVTTLIILSPSRFIFRIILMSLQTVTVLLFV